MWAIGRYDLRLGTREFWDMAPREFGALMARHVEGIKMQFRPTATLAAMYANAHLPEGQKVSAEDFVPGEGPEPVTCPELESAAWRAWAEQHNKRSG